MIYRVFPFVAGTSEREAGGALFVARAAQGAGRHDNPEAYGALYTARTPMSAVAERIQVFRGQRLSDADLLRAEGRRLALGSIDDSGIETVDLDDPRALQKRKLRPSLVATRERASTQDIALDIFAEGVSGFAWWSILEASWINVTLFAERATGLLLTEDPQPLELNQPVVRAAAEALGVLV